MTLRFCIRQIVATLAVVATVGWASSAAAAEDPDARNTSVSVNPFHLNVSGYGILSTGSGEILDHLEVRGDVVGQYLTNPLVVIPDDDRPDRALVESRAQLDATAAVGLFGRLELGAIVPLTVTQNGQLPGLGLGPVPSSGLGNVEVYAMANILSQRRGMPLGLSVGAPVVLPTATADAYLGADGIGAAPQVRLSRDIGPVTLAANVETVIQSETSLNNIQEGHRLSFRGGAKFAPSPKWDVGVEYLTSTLLASPFGNAQATRGEIVAGGRYRPTRWLDVRMAVGRGVDRGIGAPSFRAVFGLGMHFNRPPPPDESDEPEPERDPCDPDDAGQFEGVTPEDCPEADFDGDGIANRDDACPEDPEDQDGFEDEDGCPDADNDGDGIADGSDRCPNVPEQVDGFADKDGCPDPDDDGDGMADTDDGCPAKPEDFDGFEDDDGCPDPDNDDDGMTDADDNCPFGPGKPKNDGCPPQAPPEATVTGEKIELTEKIFFVTDRAIVRDRSIDVLQKVAEALKRNPEIAKVEIRGHADQRGATEYNYHLSWERAKVIRLYLIRKAGISPDRLKATGHGEVERDDASSDEEAWAEARRVEFKILERTDE